MIDISDPDLFKAQYEQHFTALKYFAMRYAESEETACDIVQELFIHLWERAGTYRDEHSFIVYLYRSVRNKCLTRLRDAKRAEARMAAADIPQSEESFLNQIIEAEIYALINDVFAELPPATRNVYTQSLEGKSHKQIAEELHIAINTIKRHKNHANRYLKERLKNLFTLISLLG